MKTDQEIKDYLAQENETDFAGVVSSVDNSNLQECADKAVELMADSPLLEVERAIELINEG